MPRMDVVDVARTWTQLTANDVTSITFQNISKYRIEVMGTVGATPPAVSGFAYIPAEGELNVLMTDLFPGVSGANRVWGRASLYDGVLSVLVSHA